MIITKYNAAAVIDGVPLITLASSDFANTVLEAGDVKVGIDNGTLNNIATLPTESPSGSKQYRVSLSAAETQGKIIVVTFIDQTDPKAFKDQRLIIFTAGHASAYFPVDFFDAVRAGLSSLPVAAPGANGGLPTVNASNKVAGVSGSVDGDVGGKVIGGGGSSITGAGVRDENSVAIKAKTDTIPAAGPASAEHYTSSRAAYMDKLNIAGQVAGANEVAAISNNTRIKVVCPQSMERPDSGTVGYIVEVLLYDETGNMEAPDSAPTIAARNHSGTDRSANLTSTTMSLVATGHYRATYNVADVHALEEILYDISVVEGAVTRKYGGATAVQDLTAVDFTSADRTDLQAVKAKTDLLAFTGGNVHGHVKAMDEAMQDEIAADVDELLTTNHGDGSWKQGVSVVGSANNSSVPVRGDMSVGASVHWSISIQAEGIDSTGWTKFVFLVKGDKDDADDDALVQIRETNGGAGDDGLQVLNRRPAADVTQGSITISQITPDTNVAVDLKAIASQFIRAQENGGYYWELVRYISDKPETIGDGRLLVERRLRRAAAAP